MSRNVTWRTVESGCGLRVSKRGNAVLGLACGPGEAVLSPLRQPDRWKPPRRRAEDVTAPPRASHESVEPQLTNYFGRQYLRPRVRQMALVPCGELAIVQREATARLAKYAHC